MLGSIGIFASYIAAAAAIAATPVSAPVPTAAQDPTRVAEGTWAGSFLQIDWTFDFRNEGGSWSGRYMTSKGNKWHPLKDVAISGRSVSFSIESTPKVSFSLEVDAANQNMSGVVTVDGVATVPFSAARRS